MIHDDFESSHIDRIAFDDRRVVIVIHHAVYCLTLPIVFGPWTAVCDGDQEEYDGVGPDSASFNIPDCIKDMPPWARMRFSVDEKRMILGFFSSSMEFVNGLKMIGDRPYIKEAVADLQAAVNHLIQLPHHYGQSKWASHQMVEKFIKSFLRARAVKIPRHHDLQCLAALAAANGLSTVPKGALDDLICGAGVRYGEINVTGIEAVKAHHASLLVCSAILPLIRKPSKAS